VNPLLSYRSPQAGVRSHAIQLIGPCGPLAQRSLISKHISLPYILNTMTVHFPAGCAGLVRVYLLISEDSSTPTDALPPGTSVLSFLSPNDYLEGDDVTIELHPAIPVPQRGTWIKAHVVNADANVHTISVQIYITELAEEP